MRLLCPVCLVHKSHHYYSPQVSTLQLRRRGRRSVDCECECQPDGGFHFGTDPGTVVQQDRLARGARPGVQCHQAGQRPGGHAECGLHPPPWATGAVSCPLSVDTGELYSGTPHTFLLLPQ